MWPMLAGLGPLLGEDTLGGFASLDSLALWGYHKGTAWIGRPSQVDVRTPVTLDPLPVVAVLTDGRTASSGEAIVIAFRGRSRTRSLASRLPVYRPGTRPSRCLVVASCSSLPSWMWTARVAATAAPLPPTSRPRRPAPWTVPSLG